MMMEFSRHIIPVFYPNDGKISAKKIWDQLSIQNSKDSSIQRFISHFVKMSSEFGSALRLSQFSHHSTNEIRLNNGSFGASPKVSALDNYFHCTGYFCPSIESS